MTESVKAGPRLTGRRLKSISLLVGIVLAALALTSWTQTWFTVILAAQSAGHPPIAAGGDTSAPAISALAIACLAAVGALAISGRFFRIVLATLQLVIGACIALSAVLALFSPLSAVLPLVTAATGIAGVGPVTALVASITATAWPWAALVAGALLMVLGVGIIATGHRWPASTRRYQAVRLDDVEESHTPEADWDSLSGGSDPTSR